MSSQRTRALLGLNNALRLAVRSLVASMATAIFSTVAVAEPRGDEPAPPLSVEQLLNAPDDASAEWDDLKGKVVVVDFWATWCAPCIASIPHLNELTERFKDEDVVFISLTDEPLETVEPFLKRKPISGWVALDTDGQTSEAYRIRAIPHTFVIGRDGKVLGDTHPADLAAEHIEKALRGEPLGLGSAGPGEAAEGAIKLATPRDLTYGRSFKPGDFPPVGFEQNRLPEPLAQVIVRPALHPEGGASNGGAEGRHTWVNFDAATVVREAYSHAYQVPSSRVDLKATLPKQSFDVAVWASQGDLQIYRRLVEGGIGGAFGLSARTEEREVDVLLLETTDAAAQKLTLTASTGGSMARAKREQDHVVWTAINETTSGLADLLESKLNVPVIDHTGLMEGYDFELILPEDVESARETLKSLGLKLIAGRRELTYLVVETAGATSGRPPAAPR